MNTVELETVSRTVELENLERSVLLELTYTQSEYEFVSRNQTEQIDKEVKLWSSE